MQNTQSTNTVLHLSLVALSSSHSVQPRYTHGTTSSRFAVSPRYAVKHDQALPCQWREVTIARCSSPAQYTTTFPHGILHSMTDIGRLLTSTDWQTTGVILAPA